MLTNGVHPLDLPDAVVAVWRGLLFIGSCIVLGCYWPFLRRPNSSPARRWFAAGVIVVLLRTVIVNIERWHQVLYLEGLPVDTIWLTLVGVALVRRLRE